jgi:hypothetical protein
MNPQTKSSFQERAQAALGFADGQVRQLVTNHPDHFPLYTVGGKWKHESEAWTNWCEGFLGGMLWILFRHTGDPWWQERAEHYSRLIGHRKTDRNVHDLGFLFLPTCRFLVRGDGSTSHEGLFDLQTGEFLRQTTHQGWRNDSSWARGQTWALYGFTTAYQFTKDARFLDTAQRSADFYLERTPAHGVPPNDWEEPNPPQPYESSAAAIAAAGLLELAQIPLMASGGINAENAAEFIRFDVDALGLGGRVDPQGQRRIRPLRRNGAAAPGGRP